MLKEIEKAIETYNKQGFTSDHNIALNMTLSEWNDFLKEIEQLKKEKQELKSILKNENLPK